MLESTLLSEIVREFRFCDSQELIFFNKFIENRNSIIENRNSVIENDDKVETNCDNDNDKDKHKEVSSVKENGVNKTSRYVCDPRIDLWDWMLVDKERCSTLDKDDGLEKNEEVSVLLYKELMRTLSEDRQQVIKYRLIRLSL